MQEKAHNMSAFKMTLSRYLWFAIVSILLSITMGYAYYFSKLQRDIKYVANNYRLQEEKYRNAFLTDFEINSALELSFTLPDTLPLSTENILVYFYSKYDCEKCVFEDLSALDEKIVTQYPQKAIVFPVFEASKNTELKLATELKDHRYMRIDSLASISLLKDGSPVRFFAILKSNGRLANIFAPDAALPERTNLYLKYVREKYF